MESPARPEWHNTNPKQRRLSEVLLERTEGKVRTLLDGLLADDDIHLYQSYGNVVSVRRLGYNDHGPVHARIVTYNALKILGLMHDAGVQTSLEAEGIGTYEDAQVAVALGAFLHDVGMGVTREGHEWHSLVLADDFIKAHLERLYPDNRGLFVALRCMVHEVIVGHMAHDRIHSVEAGTVLVADGTDMASGRSRVPMQFERDPMVGDMHRFSASAIRRVDVLEGDKKPVRICVTMDNVTGLFQVEEVMMTKVKASPIMPHVELCAFVGEDAPRYYLK